MAIFCIHCGKELEDDAVMCPECGTAVTEVTEPQEQPVSVSSEQIPGETPKTKKFKWWMIAIPVVLVVAIAVAALWPVVFGKVAPQVELYNAFQKTAEDLKVRFDGSPFNMDADTAAWDNGMTVDMEMLISLGILGDIKFGITVANDIPNSATSTLVNFDIMGQSLESGMYADEERVVFAVSDMFSGSTEVQYYGVTFATLEQDILKSPAFADATPEEREAFIKQIRALQPKNTTTDDLVKLLTDASQDLLSNMEFVTDKEAFSYQDKAHNCKTISCSMTPAQFGELYKVIEDYINSASGITESVGELGFTSVEEDAEEKNYDSLSDALINDSEGSMDYQFYLHDGKIFAIKFAFDLIISGEPTVGGFTIILGENAGTGDITFIYSLPNDDEITEMIYVMSPQSAEAGKGENIQTTTTKADGTVQETVLSYIWNQQTGELTYETKTATGDVVTGTGVIQVQADHILFKIDNILSLVNTENAGEMGDLMSMGSLPLTVNVTNKATVVIPEFINLDQWDQNYAEQYS